MTKRLKDSLVLSFAIVTGIAAVFTVLGFSMIDILPLALVKPPFLSVIIRAFILLFVFSFMTFLTWFIKGRRYEKKIRLKIGSNTVTIKPGDIFIQNAWRVIAVDTHVDTTVDDIVISKTSLHGQLVLEHGDVDGIKEAVEKEAKRRIVGRRRS